MEKRKAMDTYSDGRVQLLGNSGNGGAAGADFASASGGANFNDLFTHTDLPDIDVDEDLKVIKNRNKEIVRSRCIAVPA